MKVSDIRAMQTQEIEGEVERLRRHMFDLRAQAVTEKLENPRQLQGTRKDIARLLTVLTERGEKNVEETLHHMEAARKGRRAAK